MKIQTFSRYRNTIVIKNTIEEIDNTLSPFIFGGISVIGLFFVGKAIATYTYFGLLTLAGFIAITESIKPIKRIVIKRRNMIDIIIYGGATYAVVTAGVTIAATLTIAGLGYTMVYKPYLRNIK